jgi:tripartite ATP-independent transporter DctP family solute receptor
VVGALVLSACGGGGAEGPVELKLGHVGPPGSLFAASAEEFARRANEALAGRVTVSVFGSSQLGGDEVLLQKLKLGTVDLALPSTILSSTVPEFGLFEMPYLVQDRAHMKRIEEAIVWPKLVPAAEESGYTILAVWENGFRHVTNNVRPIVRPADLAGVKLRTPRGIWRVRLFQSYGANPTPMPLSEVFVALQTGVMDGQENPLAQIHSSKFQEVQDYLSLTGHVYTPAYLTVGRSWDRLPEDVRAELGRIARETQDFVYETAARMDAEFLESIRAEGVAVNEPDREAFLGAGQAIYEQFGESVEGGREMTREALALAGR